MFSEKPVPQWAKELDTADLPHDYFITFAAMIATGVSLVLPWFATNFLIDKVAHAIIPKESADFISNDYLPELKKAVANVEISHDDKRELAFRALGMIIKILWAFCW